MFEMMMQFVMGDRHSCCSFAPPEEPTGYERLLARARRPYATDDGHICALGYSDKQWRRFCELAGQRRKIVDDPRLASVTTGTQYIEAMCDFVAEQLQQRGTGERMDALEAGDIPCVPLHKSGSIVDDPHLSAVGFFRDIDHSSEGRLLSMDVPSRWSRAQSRTGRPAPRLGGHGAEVLGELGYDAEAIAANQAAWTGSPGPKK